MTFLDKKFTEAYHFIQLKKILNEIGVSVNFI